MKEICIYLTESILFAGISLLLYKTAIESRLSFRSCRRYLVGAALLSVIMPACKIPIWPGEVIYYTAGQSPAAGTAASAAPAVPGLCIAFYLAVTAVILTMLCAGLCRILRLRKNASIEHHGTYRIIENPRVSAPFSFFADIFLGPDYCADERRHIVEHECSHIRHRHTAEKLVMDLLRALLWINPCLWMLRRKLSEVHEYEADRDALDSGCDAEQYRVTIFRHLFGVEPEMAASGLRGTLTKKRFVMMNRRTDRRTPRVRQALVGLALVVLSVSVSFSAGSPRYLPHPQQPDAPELDYVFTQEDEITEDSARQSEPKGAIDEEVIFVVKPKTERTENVVRSATGHLRKTALAAPDTRSASAEPSEKNNYPAQFVGQWTLTESWSGNSSATLPAGHIG